MDFAPMPQPKTELGRYRILSSTAGVRVSPLILGGMSLGAAWSEGFGGGSFEDSYKLLDAWYGAGGNFVDVSNNYHNGESEIVLGKWMAERGIRDQIVVATKYTQYYKPAGDPDQRINYAGNHSKSLLLSVRDSLAKLQTEYIDVLYLHWWDYTTSVSEVMQSLDRLVKSGKVLYLGISDTPAWIVSKANEYARAHALTPFSIYQGQWNLALRDLERDIIPMALSEGMAIAPWGVMGAGKFKTEAEVEARTKAGIPLRHNRPQTEDDKKVAAALDKIAQEVGGGATGANVALAWSLAKFPSIFPLVGGWKADQALSNIEALNIKLTKEQIAELESTVPFQRGVPYNVFGTDPVNTAEGNWTTLFGAVAGHIRHNTRTPTRSGP
ncbi:hypothetical protein BOTBODRAFT_327665 [Botryobasidium botryosum FD-172 SS1]|uniref:NADP-dependent oxidoreductase domain-containing protein n=1 Tax=Botryobasidium botryosum (strain FD-172 SS1) TaxID=930990 RepID=A0A067N278_BOTB1|nr:hypothetical protein BOTBODRAFT_327665 [Botryobasidium botryosum FD-172 SS1]